MNKYIALKDLINEISSEIFMEESTKAAFKNIAIKTKAADVAPVVHGRWKPMAYDGYADDCPVWDEWECSECGHEHYGDEDTLFAYCPDCGAKMDLEVYDG